MMLHDFVPGKPYYLGVFLTGAYQEILGDMHNLFGDTDSVHVEMIAGGGYRLAQHRRGDNAGAVLRCVHFDPKDLLASYRDKIAAAACLGAEERDRFLSELTAGLEGYTYLGNG